MATSRKIVVDDQEYRWRTSRGDGDLVSVWVDRHPAILQVRFRRTGTDPSFAQYSDDLDGWVASGVRHYNLHRPAVVAGLIQAARTRGWDPLGRRPLELDGFTLLRESPTEFTHELLHDPWLELATSLLEQHAASLDRPPLEVWQERTGQPWTAIYRRPAEFAPLAVAVVLEFGVLLEAHDALPPIQRTELLVWADARQARGQPGGLALAHWLATGAIVGEIERADLRAWCRSLVESVRRG